MAATTAMMTGARLPLRFGCPPLTGPFEGEAGTLLAGTSFFSKAKRVVASGSACCAGLTVV